ncbi:hypothetical protein B0H66DRAFT_148483 [Apodospora peruviana]|uniref:Uncharacterized protein n=1 Tax=Apodospora peruviana TaxID=516989 RepID=A0AAE0IJN5_9PEZI|nr:hypothetical protein B0H66DRAFT_148483 [Apodospora peruviana]
MTAVDAESFVTLAGHPTGGSRLSGQIKRKSLATTSLRTAKPPSAMAAPTAMADYPQESSYTMVPAPQRLVPYSRNWYIARVLLRCLSFVLAVVMLGLARENTYSWTWKAAVPAGVCVAVYDLVEIAVFGVRYKVRRGMHPGATVGADLLLWLICLVCAFFHIALGTELAMIIFGTYPYSTDIDITNETILIILAIIHFILFVRACIETRQRNKSKGRNLYVYMYTPGGGRPIPVLPMKEQGAGDYVVGDAVVGQQTPGGEIDWTAATNGRAPSYVTASVGVERVGSSIADLSLAGGGLPPSTTAPTVITSPPSVYQLGDGFDGYQGPTDQVGMRYHANFGQKEIIPHRH